MEEPMSSGIGRGTTSGVQAACSDHEDEPEERRELAGQAAEGHLSRPRRV